MLFVLVKADDPMNQPVLECYRLRDTQAGERDIDVIPNLSCKVVVAETVINSFILNTTEWAYRGYILHAVINNTALEKDTPKAFPYEDLNLFW